MQEIAGCTFTYEAFPEVMGMLWKRMLHDNKQNWRRIYKSLLLLDYLIKETFNNILFMTGFFAFLAFKPKVFNRFFPSKSQLITGWTIGLFGIERERTGCDLRSGTCL